MAASLSHCVRNSTTEIIPQVCDLLKGATTKAMVLEANGNTSLQSCSLDNL